MGYKVLNVDGGQTTISFDPADGGDPVPLAATTTTGWTISTTKITPETLNALMGDNVIEAKGFGYVKPSNHNMMNTLNTLTAHRSVRETDIKAALKLTATERADLADAAADHLEEHGWVQGAYFGENETACAVGALQAASGEVLGSEGAYLIERPVLGVAHLIADMLGAKSLQGWNDTDGRTADDVITALRDYAIKTRPDAMELPTDD